MNTLLLISRIVLIMLIFFAQQSCGMQRLSNWFYGKPAQDQESHFSKLLPELQVLFFRYSDNKANFQLVNTELSKIGSIKSEKIFDDEGLCYGIDHSHMSRIFWHALYKKNYQGVENILKNSYLKKTEYKHMYYRNLAINEEGKEVVLDPHCLAEDDEAIKLLQQYKVASLPSDKIACQPTRLIMACLLGSSDSIEHSMKGDKINIKNALSIAIDCDHARCVQQIIYLNDGFEDLFFYDEIRSLLRRELLRRACINKSCKALEVVLQEGRFINEVVNDVTLLDEVLEVAQKDSSFESVVSLLQRYGAKTAEQLIAEKNEDLERYLVLLAWT